MTPVRKLLVIGLSMATMAGILAGCSSSDGPDFDPNKIAVKQEGPRPTPPPPPGAPPQPSR